MTETDIKNLIDIAAIEFSDIVEDIVSDTGHLRIFLKEGSFIDIWYSLYNKGRYSYHWERRIINGKIYRHNNAPHKRWENIPTFPKHFHNGNELEVEPSKIPDEYTEAVRYFLNFVKQKIK